MRTYKAWPAAAGLATKGHADQANTIYPTGEQPWRYRGRHTGAYAMFRSTWT